VLFSFFLALLIPLVSAQYEGIYSMFGFLFGTGEGAFIFLKAAVWIILFAIIFWASKKMFSGSKGIATIFSIVVSLISIRFIPDEYIYYIGSAYGVFGIVVLILAIIGGTLLILNSYFPIKQHKAFGVVWAMFYFFIAWIFNQLIDINTGIYQADELLPVIGPWGKWVCIVLGIACLLRAFSGTSGYAPPRHEPPPRNPPRGHEPSPQNPPEPQIIRVRSLTSLKEKYHNYVFNLYSGRSTEQRAKRRRQRMIHAMKLIIREAERMGCPRERFLHSRIQGGIGRSKFQRPEFYEQQLRERGLI